MPQKPERKYSDPFRQNRIKGSSLSSPEYPVVTLRRMLGRRVMTSRGLARIAAITVGMDQKNNVLACTLVGDPSTHVLLPLSDGHPSQAAVAAHRLLEDGDVRDITAD